MVEYREMPSFPGYKIGNDGTVWSCSPRGQGRARLKKQFEETWRQLNAVKLDSGYYVVVLYRDGKRSTWRLGPLVLTAFIGPRPTSSHDCCHNNGDKSDNSLLNLRWDTKQANSDDKKRHGTSGRGEANPSAKLTLDNVREIRGLLANRMKQSDVAKRFGVSHQIISAIATGEAWGWSEADEKTLPPELPLFRE